MRFPQASPFFSALHYSTFMIVLFIVLFEKSDSMDANKAKDFMRKQADQQALVSLLVSVAYWLLLLLYLEVLLHLSTFGILKSYFLLVSGFTAVFAFGLALLTSLFPRTVNYLISLVLTIFVILIYGSQMIYYFVFGSLYSISQVGQGGDAITTFWRELLVTMGDNIPWILLLFVPIAAIILLHRFYRKSFSRATGLWLFCLAVLAVAVQLVTLWGIRLGGTDYFSNHYFYTSNTTTTDQAADRFGLLTALRLDITGKAASAEEEGSDYYIPIITESTEPEATESTEPTAPKVIEYNVLDIDLDSLSTKTENKKIQALNDYISQLSGTNKNDYTGLLKDYNLILLCAEAFSPAAIQPDITPTLYKLTQQGIIFNNFYNTFPNNTTDGEYALCMGQYPDASRDQNKPSFNETRHQYLPYCLGNAFTDQLGLTSYGYHNYRGYYYNRVATHPNMGYKMKFSGAGMTFTTGWPASDYEMMQQSIDDYIGQEQFHAYYMTFSGHMSYNRSTNKIAARNYDLVKDLDLGEQAKCYLSCHIELDKAMAYLLERLEEAGIADRTAIVIVGDHFPYGMTELDQYSDLVGYEIDAFNKYKSSLVFWVGGMEENIVVDEYCCNVDVLPTLLNLWGLQYDSRMLAGTDVFSDGTHMAVLKDGSIFTDKMWLNATTGEIRYQVPESQLPQGYAENMVKLVQTKQALSRDVLSTGYYNFVFGKDRITSEVKHWGYPAGE